MTREEEIKARLEKEDAVYLDDYDAFDFRAEDDMKYLLARNEELQRLVEKMQAVVDAAKRASYEYFHPASGDGDIINKMYQLEGFICDLDAKENPEEIEVKAEICNE